MNAPLQSPLRFMIEPAAGKSYEVNLTEFATGARKLSLVAPTRSNWGGDFSGRPQLAHELAEYIRLTRPSHANFWRLASAARCLCRFLDSHDPKGEIKSLMQLTDAHGESLRLLLLSEHNSANVYQTVKSLVYAIRGLSGATDLYWPTRPAYRNFNPEKFNAAAAKRFYNALKKEAMSIKQMFREGQRLAECGVDPRNGSRRDWAPIENQAWLLRELTKTRLLTTQEYFDHGARALVRQDAELRSGGGPSYLAPGMAEDGEVGISRKLRWFHPSTRDTIVFLWLFLLGTGWNISTALAVDVTSTEKWYQPHPQKPTFAVIHSLKTRINKQMFSLSLTKPEWHPYQIIQYMIQITAPLRRTLEANLQAATALYEQEPSAAHLDEIRRIRSDLKSPWLCFQIWSPSVVKALDLSEMPGINKLARLTVKRHKLDEQNPELLRISSSDARDAWINHAYGASGQNALIAKLAAQHSDLSSLKHYVNRSRFHSQNEEAVRRVQNAAFDEISARGHLDPTRLRLLVSKGEITAEQEQRLLDVRQRTRLGMGCIDPQNPPAEVAPDHLSGSLCRVQRCTGCKHGLVFEESHEPLAKALAELIHLKQTMPLASWADSSLEDEEYSITKALQQFNPTRTASMISAWLVKYSSGEVIIHENYPSY